MAKTVNSNIDIFTSLKSAERAFIKSDVPCQLLKSTYGAYFLDRSKTAIVDWPKQYVLISEK